MADHVPPDPRSPIPKATFPDLNGPGAWLADALALLPHLVPELGGHLFALQVHNTTDQVTCVIVMDLDAFTRDPSATASTLAEHTATRPDHDIVLVAFGRHDQTGPALHAAHASLLSVHTTVRATLQAQPIHITESGAGGPTPSAQPGKDNEQHDAAGQSQHTAIRTATTHAARALVEEIEACDGDTDLIAAFAHEVPDVIHAALSTYRHGDSLGHRQLARLSLLMYLLPLREIALATITADNAHDQKLLWSDVVDRAVVNSAACAILLAHACTVTGDTDQALMALQWALRANPQG